MKSLSNHLYNLVLFSIVSLYCSNQSFGQEKVNISAGFGVPELINVGVRYQLKQAQIGIGLGSLPSEGRSISVSGDVYYHFAGLSELSNRRPWYGRIGLAYYRGEDNTFITKSLYLYLRVGRDFNISKKFGVQIDIGPVFELYEKEIRKIPSNGWLEGLDFGNVLPSFGIGLFYRI